MPADARIRHASWLLAAGALLLVLVVHLLPALLAGLLVYELVHLTAPLLERRLSNRRAKLAAVLLLAVLIVSGIAVGTMFLATFFRGETSGLTALAARMADALENSRQRLPDWLAQMLPQTVEGTKAAMAHWLREHAGEVRLVGKETARALVHIFFGLVIGAMLALHETFPDKPMGPLATALAQRARRLADAFRRVVFAQVRISAINTTFTAIYLIIVLPLVGVHLPLTKTLVAVTFIAGLLPVIGNLISNTVIVIVSLSHSPEVALASLAFLVVIHKLEYFLNARIVGGQISAKTWELLLAMLTMEAAFGVPGLVAAPIYYAYAKDELARAELI